MPHARKDRCHALATMPVAPFDLVQSRAEARERTHPRPRARIDEIDVMNYRRHGAAAARFAERRRREDDAPRLCEQVPDLISLRLEIEERSGVTGTQPRHIRRLVVDRAPALFLVPCGDPRCVEGEHDLTETIMRALRAREASFQGEDECAGTVGTSPCGRVLHFDATAEYRP